MSKLRMSEFQSRKCWIYPDTNSVVVELVHTQELTQLVIFQTQDVFMRICVLKYLFPFSKGKF